MKRSVLLLFAHILCTPYYFSLNCMEKEKNSGQLLKLVNATEEFSSPELKKQTQDLINEGYLEINTPNTHPYSRPGHIYFPLHDCDNCGMSSGIEGVANLRHHCGNRALCRAAELGYEYLVSCLLMHGAAVNIGDRFQRSPLHFSAGNGLIRIAQILLQAGANPHLRDSEGRTPLHYTLPAQRLE